MVDTVASASPVRTPEFEQFLFGSARPAAVGMDSVQVQARSLGLLSIPDGRVFACDPFVPMDSTPLAERLAPGQYDGTYDTWLGRDARGEPAMILTDFDVLRSEEYVSRVHAEWAARKAKKWWQVWR
jgi:hypothetical protein